MATVLLLSNLGNRCLWQDEAESALLSKTILTHGVPFGYDGKNFFSQEGDSAYGKNYLWVMDPWLSYYLVAAFFKMFGIGTFTARLPFALFGVGTIGLTYFLAKRLFKDSKTAAVAAVLLCLSVLFLLMCRQCRYYSLASFLSLLGLYGYLMLLENKKGGATIFLISAILLFHCQHLFCAVLLATVFVHCLLCCRQKAMQVFILSVVIVLVSLPWLIWVSEMRLVGIYGYHLFDKNFFVNLKEYLRTINSYIFPFYLLLIPLGKGLFLWVTHKGIKTAILEDGFLWKNLLLLLLFAVFTTVALSIASCAVLVRYMTQLIPVFCIITAVIVMSVIRPYFKPAVVIIATLLVMALFVNYQMGENYPYPRNKAGIWYLKLFDYLEEITHDYDGPIEGIVKYLNENGSDKDIVAITFDDLPLKFYTNMRVVGGLTKEDLSPAKDADWVIFRKYMYCPEEYEVTLYLRQNIPLDEYRKIVIDSPDIQWSNRPDPLFHEFRTVKNEDRVLIYKKKQNEN